MLRRLLCVVGVLACAVSAFAAKSVKAPSVNAPSDVFAKMESDFKQINDYKVDVELTMKGADVSMNKMPMTVYYKKPDKVRVDSKEGIAIAPQGMVNQNPAAMFTKNFKPKYVRAEKHRGIDCWLFKVSDTRHPGADLLIWVDPKRAVVVSVESRGQFKMKSDWDYQKIGNVYLPSKTVTEMEMPAMQPQPGRQSGPPPMMQGKTTLTTVYKNYRVNKGIPDSVFVQKKTK